MQNKKEYHTHVKKKPTHNKTIPDNSTVEDLDRE